jgi:predicted transcriptional regulator
MSKHRRGYFKGKYDSYLITAYTSYRKSTEILSNKELAKELGISVRSLYYYKRGQGTKGEGIKKVKSGITKELTKKNGKLNQEGKIIFRAVKKLREKYPNPKKMKELSIKQVNKLKEDVSKTEQTQKEMIESFYEGEN